MPDIATDTTLTSLTPQQAASRAEVSRGTIMNAIRDGSLVALRDNRNRWQIIPDNLAKWLSLRTVTASDNVIDRTTAPDTDRPPDPDENTIRIAVLEAEAKAKDQRISDLERDRDSWREQAQILAVRRSRRWWPF